MYLPLDPYKNPDLWNQLEGYLKKYDNYFLVKNGLYNNKAKNEILSDYNAASEIAKMQECNYVIVGTSHNQPMPPHYAILITDNSANLIEYITDSVSIDNEIYFMAQLLFFMKPEVISLKVPFKFELAAEDIALEHKQNGDTIILPTTLTARRTK